MARPQRSNCGGSKRNPDHKEAAIDNAKFACIAVGRFLSLMARVAALYFGRRTSRPRYRKASEI